MATEAIALSTELEEAEFQLTANRSDRGLDEYLTGCVRGYQNALYRAKTLAATGWRVTVDCATFSQRDEPRVIFEP